MKKLFKSIVILFLMVSSCSALAMVKTRNYSASVYISAEKLPEVAATGKVTMKIIEALAFKCGRKQMKVDPLSIDLDINCEFKEKRWYGPREDSIKCKGSGTADCRQTFFGF